jgi:hypothetical protein
MRTSVHTTRTHRVVMLLFALAVLVPSLLGFGTKFLEFIALYRGDVEGAFAISPILNYLLASFGFLLLFGWAAMSGMFHDIEAPKYTMLENEALLDESQHSPAHSRLDWQSELEATRSDRPAAKRTPRF